MRNFSCENLEFRLTSRSFTKYMEQCMQHLGLIFSNMTLSERFSSRDAYSKKSLRLSFCSKNAFLMIYKSVSEYRYGMPRDILQNETFHFSVVVNNRAPFVLFIFSCFSWWHDIVIIVFLSIVLWHSSGKHCTTFGTSLFNRFFFRVFGLYRWFVTKEADSFSHASYHCERAGRRAFSTLCLWWTLWFDLLREDVFLRENALKCLLALGVEILVTSFLQRIARIMKFYAPEKLVHWLGTSQEMNML